MLLTHRKRSRRHLSYRRIFRWAIIKCEVLWSLHKPLCRSHRRIRLSASWLYLPFKWAPSGHLTSSAWMSRNLCQWLCCGPSPARVTKAPTKNSINEEHLVHLVCWFGWISVDYYSVHYPLVISTAAINQTANKTIFWIVQLTAFWVLKTIRQRK